MSERAERESRPIDPGAYRTVIGRFATGVAIITATHRGRRLAMTANSITSISLEPRLVLASFMHESDTGAAVRGSGRFGLSILEAEHGRDIARRCAGKLDPAESDDQLAGIATCTAPDGLVLIEGALECLICGVEQIHVVGDHDVVVGRAERVPEAEAPGEPLVFYDGGFWRLGAPPD